MTLPTYPASIFASCYAVVMLLGVGTGNRIAVNIGLCALSFVAVIGCLNEVQLNGNHAYGIAAIAPTLIGGLAWKQLFPRDLPRSERRAMRQLFPQCGFIGMLIHDERLKTWELKK